MTALRRGAEPRRGGYWPVPPPCWRVTGAAVSAQAAAAPLRWQLVLQRHAGPTGLFTAVVAIGKGQPATHLPFIRGIRYAVVTYSR